MSFEKFWAAYPRRVAKGAAMKAWTKLKPDEALTEKILNAIEAQMRYRKQVEETNSLMPKWRRTFLPEIKHPATWLRAMCWEDEIPETEAPKKTARATPCTTCKKEEGKYPVAGVLYCIKCYDRAAHPENYAPKLRVVK